MIEVKHRATGVPVMIQESEIERFKAAGFVLAAKPLQEAPKPVKKTRRPTKK